MLVLFPVNGVCVCVCAHVCAHGCGWGVSVSQHKFVGASIWCPPVSDSLAWIQQVVRKVVAGIIQSYVQRVAETALPDSQCGFRRGRGCSDMTFVVRQLAKKAIEHRRQQFLIFIDHKKAFNSVPRDAL